MRFCLLSIMLCLYIALSGCVASTFGPVPNAQSYQSAVQLPIDGKWSKGNASLAIGSGVLYYTSHQEPDHINKAIVINIAKQNKGVFRGNCFNYSDKVYDLPCKIELFKPNQLAVFYNDGFLYSMTLESAQDSAAYKAEADASSRTASSLTNFTQCSNKCESVRGRCEQGCLNKMYSKMTLDAAKNTIYKIEYDFCSEKCSNDKRSCTSDCSGILD